MRSPWWSGREIENKYQQDRLLIVEDREGRRVAERVGIWVGRVREFCQWRGSFDREQKSWSGFDVIELDGGKSPVFEPQNRPSNGWGQSMMSVT